MKTITNVKSIQKKCELIARESEVIQQFDLVGSYGEIAQQVIDNYDKEYDKGLIELSNMINAYLSDFQPDIEEVNKKCEYCNNNRDYMDTIVFGERGEFFIDINGKLLAVEYSRNLYDDTITDNVDIKINYCPMCGREL